MIPNSRIGLIALFAALTLAVFAIGFTHIRFHKAQILDDIDRELSMVASLRSTQVLNWFQTTRLQALQIINTPNTAQLLASFFQGDRPPNLEMNDWLKALQRHYGYFDVLLVNTNGIIRACAMAEHNHEQLPPECLKVFQHAMLWRQHTWHDIHWQPQQQHPVIEFLVPVQSPDAQPGSEALGAVVFQMNPDDIIFPNFRVWPVTRRTGETYLLKPEKDHFVYLTEPMEGQRSALRFYLAQTNLVGVQIALGAEGMLRGHDYRDKMVYAKGIKLNTPDWLLVAKIDEEEVTRDFRNATLRTAGFMTVVLTAFCAVILSLWIHREHETLRNNIKRDQKLEVILNSIGDAVIATDARGRITRMNPVAEELTGWNLLEAYGRHLDEVFKIINGLTREKVPSPADRVLAEGKIMGLANHTLLIAQNGAESPIADSGAPIRDPTGAILGVVLVFRDVAQDYARERDLCMRSQALEATQIPIAFADLEGKISYVNPAFLKAWGYGAQEHAMGRHVESFWGFPEQARSVLARLSRGEPWEGELEAATSNGFSRVMHVTANMVRGPDGRPICYVASFLDMTEFRHLTEHLREAKTAAEAANRAKSLFLANMTHELRTPLNPIIGFADLLMDAENLTNEQRHFVEMIRQRSSDLLRLITDIIDLSKIETDTVTLLPEPMALRSFIADLARSIAPMAQAKGLEFSVIVDPAVPDMISADSLRLRQVLMNLLSNALKFTEQGAVTLQVELASDASGALRFLVRDTGIGISPEVREHLFKPFTQGDMGFTRRFGGAGLGLAISQRLVRKMGGEISVDSEADKGASFHFTLNFPASETQALAPTPQATAKITPKATSSRVLIVEDDPSNRSLIEIILRKAGYIYVSAEDGEQALLRFKEEPPDIVLLDIQLPRMNGLELASHIRKMDKEAGRHTPIVVVTSYAMRGDRERFIAAGMDAYVSKPIQTSILLKTIKDISTGLTYN